MRYRYTGIQSTTRYTLHLFLDRLDPLEQSLLSICITGILIELQSFFLHGLTMCTELQFEEVVLFRGHDDNRHIRRELGNGLEQLFGCRLQRSRTVDVDTEPGEVGQ